MNSDRRLPLGDVIRLILVTLLAAWLLIFSLPAAMATEGGILGSILRASSNARQMSILPAAAPPATEPQLPIPTVGQSKPASAPTSTPMPTIAPPTATPVSTSTPTPTNTPLPTNTPTITPTPSNTPTRTPVPPTNTPRPPTATPVPPTPTPVPPPPVAWDGRLAFLGVGIAGANVAPGQQYWRVSKGIFEDWNEGGQGHAIAVEVLDEAGNRLGLPFGADIGLVQNGGQTVLAWTKLDMAYPSIFDMYGTLGSYTAWITLGGLPSERVYGMGLVDTTDDGVLTNEHGGKVHCNYKITFQRATK